MTSQPVSPTGSPVANLLGGVTEQISRLIRQEIQLAQTELEDKVKHAGAGAGLLGVAGVAGLLGVAATVTGVGLLLRRVMPDWAAALLVGGALTGGAGALVVLAKQEMERAVPEQTIASVREGVEQVQQAVAG